MNQITQIINWKNFILMTLIGLGIFAFIQKDTASAISDRNTVMEWIKSGALIVDVRTPQEFSAGNYPGSINIPLSDIEKNLNRFGNKEQKIIVYCRSGNRSGQAKKILESNGFINVINGGGLSDMPR